jgi:hypothetical protein
MPSNTQNKTVTTTEDTMTLDLDRLAAVTGGGGAQPQTEIAKDKQDALNDATALGAAWMGKPSDHWIANPFIPAHPLAVAHDAFNMAGADLNAGLAALAQRL